MEPQEKKSPHEVMVSKYVSYIESSIQRIPEAKWDNFTLDMTKLVQTYTTTPTVAPPVTSNTSSLSNTMSMNQFGYGFNYPSQQAMYPQTGYMAPRRMASSTISTPSLYQQPRGQAEEFMWPLTPAAPAAQRQPLPVAMPDYTDLNTPRMNPVSPCDADVEKIAQAITTTAESAMAAVNLFQ